MIRKDLYLIAILTLSYLVYLLFFNSNSILNYYSKVESLNSLEKKISDIEYENRNLEHFSKTENRGIQDMLQLGYKHPNERIVDIKPPSLNNISRSPVEKVYLIPPSTIIFYSFLIFFIIIFLVLKYQSKLRKPDTFD